MILKAIVTFVIAVLLFDFEKDELASRQQIPGKWEQFYLGNGESTASMPDQIIELTTLLPTQIKASVMSTFDVFVEKGRKQKTENAVRNLIKSLYSPTSKWPLH